MRVLARCIEAASRACGHVAAALVIVLMLLMAYEVALRYALNAPTIWSYDIVTAVLGTIFLLGISYTLATDAHVRVDLLHPLFGRKGRPLIDLVGYGVVLLPLLIWLSAGLWEHFYGAYLSNERAGTSAWNPVVWPFRAIMFAGAAMWTLQTLAEVIKAVLELAGRPLADAGTRQPPE